MSVLSFSWKGRSSDDYGICVRALPFVYSPGARYESYTVPGRDGILRIPDGSLEELTLNMDCYLPYEQGGSVAALAEIRDWLRGEGWFTQSDIPGRRFKARITDGIAMQPLLDGFADRIFGVTIYADPYQYHVPATEGADDIQLTAAGTIVNPGTAASLPRITIAGSGDITLTIGGQYMEFSGVAGGIIVDSEAMDVYEANGVTLANGKAGMDDFPRLPPGNSAVSWTGGVTKVTIRPRWRDI